MIYLVCGFCATFARAYVARQHVLIFPNTLGPHTATPADHAPSFGAVCLSRPGWHAGAAGGTHLLDGHSFPRPARVSACGDGFRTLPMSRSGPFRVMACASPLPIAQSKRSGIHVPRSPWRTRPRTAPAPREQPVQGLADLAASMPCPAVRGQIRQRPQRYVPNG